VDPQDTAGLPAPEVNRATLGTTTIADFSAIIVRQEREKQTLLADIEQLTIRAEAAEEERNRLGLTLLGAAAHAEDMAWTIESLGDLPPGAVTSAARDAAVQLMLAGEAMRASTDKARYAAKEIAILYSALDVAWSLLGKYLRQFERDRPALPEAPELLDRLLADLHTLAANMERALRRATLIGQEGESKEK
jgi:hypothetical protein